MTLQAFTRWPTELGHYRRRHGIGGIGSRVWCRNGPARFHILLALAGLMLAPFLALSGQSITLERVKALPGGDNPLFGRIVSARITDGGVLIVGDQANHRLYRFSLDGALLDSVGGLGAGPGEFRVLGGLGVGPDGRIAILDIALRRIVHWGSDGAFAGTTPIMGGAPVALVGWEGGPLVATTNHRDAITVARFGGGNPEVRSHLPVGEAILEPDEAHACLFCEVLVQRNGRILVGATNDSTWRLLQLDSAGAVIGRWTRPPIPPGRRSEEELDELIHQLERGPRGRALRPRESYRYPPRISRLAEDPRGRIWVLAHHNGDSGSALDLFDASGRFLGSTRVPERFRGIAVDGTRVVGWGETADGEPAVWIYRVR